MLERVEAVLVAGENLDRCNERRHPHRHREHHARAFAGRITQQMPGADTADHESGGQVRGEHHMHQPVGERGIEDHLPPVGRRKLARGIDGVAGGRLHPGVRGQNPERREQRAGRDHQRREEMQFMSDALEPEQHHAEEACLEEECGQHFIGHQWPDHRADLVREARPVGAELVRHHDAGHDTHAEGDGEDLQPVIEQVDENLAAGPQPEGFEHGEIAGEADRECRKHDVKRHREGELRARQLNCADTVHHRDIHSAQHCLAYSTLQKPFNRRSALRFADDDNVRRI